MNILKLLQKRASDGPKEAKVKLSGEDFAAQNPYYAAIARGYHLAQLTLFGILTGFIIISMLIRSDDITYENFFYLFKDIHAAVDSADVSFTTLVYNADETQDYATYRGGLAVAGESGLTVFSATGRQTMVQTLNMTTPHLLTSSRCILVYEQGGNEFSLYNSFARITAGKSADPISCAAISDSGWFALASQSGTSSKIAVYDKHSDLKTEHFKNGFIDKKAALPAILAGLAGTALFAWLATALPTELLRRCFGVFLLYIGVRELFRKEKPAGDA